MTLIPQRPIAPKKEPCFRGQEALIKSLAEREEREKKAMKNPIINKNTLAYSCACISMAIIFFWAGGEFDTLRAMISIPLIWLMWAFYAVANREED